MRILTRYILKEIGSHALLGVALFTFIIFMRDLGRLAGADRPQQRPAAQRRRDFSLTLPTTFTITLPMGVLVGILVGLSRLAADSEVTAMRASGMGVGMFVRAVSIFAIGAWLLGMFNSIYIAPQVGDRAGPSAGPAEVVAGVVRNPAARFLRRVQEHCPVCAGRDSVQGPGAVARQFSWPTSAIPLRRRSRWPSAARC